MPTLAEVRQQYPQYQDMSDATLAKALHEKFYSDMPREDFDAKIGYQGASMPEAIGRGLKSGATVGFNDEIAGVAGAGKAIEPTEWERSLGMRSTEGQLPQLIDGLVRLVGEKFTGGDTASQGYTKGRDEARALDEKARTDRPYSYGGGQLAGGAAVTLPVAPLGIGATTGATILRSGALGAGLGAAQGAGDAPELKDTPAYAGGGAILGGAVGGLIPAAVGGVKRLAQPFATAPERQVMVDALRREGVEVTAGQATGSKPLRWAESSLGDVPGAGSKAAEVQTRQAEQFTAAALKRAGENATRATPDVIDNAFSRIGQQFDDLAARNWIEADGRLVADLTKANKEYTQLVSQSQRVPVVEETLSDILDQMRSGGNVLKGDAYKVFRERLGKAGRKTSDNQARDAIFDIQHALDDAMERTLAKRNAPDMGAWKEVRRQYRNMLVVEKAATGAGENAALGLISPSALRNATVAQGRRAYARGKGDFAELARAGEAIMKPLPNSGTAARSTPLLMGATGALGGFPALLTALAGPAAAGRVLMSAPVQGWLQRPPLPGAGAGAAYGAAMLGVPTRQYGPALLGLTGR